VTILLPDNSRTGKKVAADFAAPTA